MEDIAEIMKYGAMSTPGVIIDGKVVHVGGVPAKDKIDAWLAGSATESAATRAGGCCSGGKFC